MHCSIDFLWCERVFVARTQLQINYQPALLVLLTTIFIGLHKEITHVLENAFTGWYDTSIIVPLTISVVEPACPSFIMAFLRACRLENDDNGEAVQKENATATIVEINRIGPDGIGSATGVVFYDTNSTGQLAFLDNMIGISQREITPEGYTIRVWEWKGVGTLPLENNSGAGIAAAGNQTTTTAGTLQEE